jgi:hypothetical protein
MKPAILAVAVLSSLAVGTLTYQRYHSGQPLDPNKQEALRDALEGDINGDMKTVVSGLKNSGSDVSAIPGKSVSQPGLDLAAGSGKAEASNWVCAATLVAGSGFSVPASQVGDCNGTKEETAGFPYLVDDGSIFRNKQGRCVGTPVFINCELESKVGYFLHPEVHSLKSSYAGLGSTNSHKVREGGLVSFGVNTRDGLSGTLGENERDTVVQVAFEPSLIKKGLFGKEREAGVFVLEARTLGLGGPRVSPKSQKIECGDTAHFLVENRKLGFELMLRLECQQ